MSQRDLVDKVAATLITAWETAEDRKVNTSYIATFADMARAVIEDYDIKEPSGDTDSE